MFTGIIKKISQIEKVEKKGVNVGVSIKKPDGFEFPLGSSVAINGVCSTVVENKNSHFSVLYMPETLKKTTVSFWKEKDVVNLEQSLSANELLDGHIVTGHVDTKGEISSRQDGKKGCILKILFPPEFSKFIAPKGSVAVDGVSLTVVDSTKETFTVALVPYTLLHTNLGKKREKDKVNIETDILAKYLARLIGISQ
ncbi:MAG: riboflavin synthase [bacterium]|nr:riboflavin synthase [bacterium]